MRKLTTFRTICARIAAAEVTAVLAGAFAVMAQPASAQNLIAGIENAWVQTGNGAASDFSYSPGFFEMTRNVEVAALGFAPNTSVTFAWRDSTTGGAWTVEPSVVAPQPDPSSLYDLTSIVEHIFSIPRSTCGDMLDIQASGSTGVWTAKRGARPLRAVTASTTKLMRVCVPRVTGEICKYMLLAAPGQVDVANALDASTPCIDDSYEGIDLTTGLSDPESDYCGFE